MHRHTHIWQHMCQQKIQCYKLLIDSLIIFHISDNFSNLKWRDLFMTTPWHSRLNPTIHSATHWSGYAKPPQFIYTGLFLFIFTSLSLVIQEDPSALSCPHWHLHSLSVARIVVSIHKPVKRIFDLLEMETHWANFVLINHIPWDLYILWSWNTNVIRFVSE